MKKYKVIKTYIILAEDDTHLKAKLLNGAVNSIERYRISQEITKVQQRAVKKGWKLWVAGFAKQLRYLAIGH